MEPLCPRIAVFTTSTGKNAWWLIPIRRWGDSNYSTPLLTNMKFIVGNFQQWGWGRGVAFLLYTFSDCKCKIVNLKLRQLFSFRGEKINRKYQKKNVFWSKNSNDRCIDMLRSLYRYVENAVPVEGWEHQLLFIGTPCSLTTLQAKNFYTGKFWMLNKRKNKYY